MNIPVRNQGGEDNLCEKIMNDECKDCFGCMDENQHFEINESNDFFTITFYYKIGEIVISRHSERISKTTLKPL